MYFLIMANFDQSLKLFVTVGQITAGPPLAPLLGQYDIKPANDFVNKLNEAVIAFESGVPVSVTVKRNSKTKNFVFVVNGPTIMNFIDNFSKLTRRRKREFLTFKDVYEIARIRHLIWLKFRKDDCPSLVSIVKSLLATIKSARVYLKPFKKKKIKCEL
jgi:ribosomal protein L11